MVPNAGLELTSNLTVAVGNWNARSYKFNLFLRCEKSEQTDDAKNSDKNNQNVFTSNNEDPLQ